MDFRDLFRNFLGINRRIETPEFGQGHENDRKNPREDTINNNGSHHTRPNDRPDFIFGEMLNSMEDMFKEMEQSFSEIDSFFQGSEQSFGNNQFRFGNFGNQDNYNDEGLPSLPPPQEEKDANVRDLVLKDPEKARPSLNKPAERVDRDLDDLFSNSEFPLSEIPLAPKSSEAPVPKDGGTSQVLVERPKNGWNGFSSSFERVYSTHSFKNGRWEGKTVRENNDGKEITTYTRNANGEQEETTEFIPNGSIKNDTCPPADRNEGQQHYNPFQILERLFKPKL